MIFFIKNQLVISSFQHTSMLQPKAFIRWCAVQYYNMHRNIYTCTHKIAEEYIHGTITSLSLAMGTKIYWGQWMFNDEASQAINCEAHSKWGGQGPHGPDPPVFKGWLLWLTGYIFVLMINDNNIMVSWILYSHVIKCMHLYLHGKRMCVYTCTWAAPKKEPHLNLNTWIH